MKKLLLAIYIILVVTASLAARAEFVPPVRVETAAFEYHPENQTIVMAVQYPNPCIREARAVLARSEYANVLYIDAAARRFGVGCVQPADQNPEVEVKPISAVALKFELRRLNQDLDGVYTIMSRDGSFRQTIDFSQVNMTAAIPHAEINGILLTPAGNHDMQLPDEFVFGINTAP